MMMMELCLLKGNNGSLFFCLPELKSYICFLVPGELEPHGIKTWGGRVKEPYLILLGSNFTWLWGGREIRHGLPGHYHYAYQTC